MRTLKKLTITLALLLTAVGGAWATEETLLTTITPTAKEQASYSTANVATVSFSYTTDGSSAYLANWGWWGYGWIATVTAAEGYTITKCIFYDDANRTATDSEAPFVVETTEEDKTPRINGTPIDGGNQWSKGIKKIEVYGYKSEPTEWDLTSQDGKNWTLAKMPANNIELQVEYYAESNLFLSKNALADKTNIAVTAGELGVQFGNDGKSANTITEGTPMTVKYNGTKKVIGFKVAKAAAPVYTLLSAATTSDYGKVVCAAGHLHDAKTAVPAGCTAVGILGKVTETGHGLILALKDAPQQTWNTIDGWTSASYAGTTLKVLPDDAARGTNLTSYTTLGATTVSNWALAQKSDYQAIFQNLGTTNFDKVYDDNVNAYITGAGGTAMSGEFLSATPFQTSEFVEFFYIDEWGYGFKTTNFIVRPVLGF